MYLGVNSTDEYLSSNSLAVVVECLVSGHDRPSMDLFMIRAISQCVMNMVLLQGLKLLNTGLLTYIGSLTSSSRNIFFSEPPLLLHRCICSVNYSQLYL